MSCKKCRGNTQARKYYRVQNYQTVAVSLKAVQMER